MNHSFTCWKCGHNINDMSLPLCRTDRCPKCQTDLYVCRMCDFYDAKVSDQCREPIAERVMNKERANFCGYFQLNCNAYAVQNSAAGNAQEQLAALFGTDTTPTTDHSTTNEAHVKTALEQLFKADSDKS